jgi:hypothetical protein
MVLIGNMRAAASIDLMPLIMDQQRLVGTRATSLSAWNLALRTVERSGFGATLGDEVDLDGAIDRFEALASGTAGAFTILPNATGPAR